MKEVSSKITDKNGKEYTIIFNLNVMQEIQEKYGSLEKWGELTDGKVEEVGSGKSKKVIQHEPDIKALIFGVTCMINEGIDIENDENGTNEPFLTEKKVGRIMTDVGMDEITSNMNDLVIESTKSDEKN